MSIAISSVTMLETSGFGFFECFATGETKNEGLVLLFWLLAKQLEPCLALVWCLMHLIWTWLVRVVDQAETLSDCENYESGLMFVCGSFAGGPC